MEMAKEGRLRKVHHRDRPGFSRRVIPDHLWQQVDREGGRPSERRVRGSHKYLLLCWMVMGWSVQNGQLMGLLLWYAAMALGAKVGRCSLARGLRAIRRAIKWLRRGQTASPLIPQLGMAVVDTYIRHSSKRAGAWPHKKSERPPGPPRMRRPSQYEITRIRRAFSKHVRSAA